MFLDASAIVAMMTGEADADTLADRLERAPTRFTSGIAVFETVAAVARKNSFSIDEARDLVARFLAICDVTIRPVDALASQEALRAFERFGKGRHPASLNMGDCFAYGMAKALDLPLLFKGDDFPQTDIVAA